MKSALDDPMAKLRASAAAADRTFHAASSSKPKPVGRPRGAAVSRHSLSLHDATLIGRARALWKTRRLDTVDIAHQLGMTEADVCRAIGAQQREAAE